MRRINAYHPNRIEVVDEGVTVSFERYAPGHGLEQLVDVDVDRLERALTAARSIVLVPRPVVEVVDGMSPGPVR